MTYDISDGCECNNTFETACPVSINSTFDAKLWGLNKIISDGTTYDKDEDQDFFAIHPTQCGVENISVTGMDGTQPILIEVFDSFGATIGSYQGQPGEDPTNLSVLLSNNLYYIKLTALQPFWPYSYILVDDPFNVSLTYDISDGCECNNTFETACPVSINSTFDVKLWGINKIISNGTTYDRDEDQDFYKIHPTCIVDTVSICVTNINGTQPILIEVYDSTQQNLIYSQQGQPGINVCLNNILLHD
ncbi:MAG: hypothetical protein IPO63_09775, partial [Bacteroidetes bacterium]|nr:hypothetical protein [Bacteroidota bacterium]